jgi:hypothetical protein
MIKDEGLTTQKVQTLIKSSKPVKVKYSKSGRVTPQEFAYRLEEAGEINLGQLDYLGKYVKGQYRYGGNLKPQIVYLESIKGRTLQKVLGHEISHYQTPEYILEMRGIGAEGSFIEYFTQPSEIIARGLASKKVSWGYKAKNTLKPNLEKIGKKTAKQTLKGVEVGIVKDTAIIEDVTIGKARFTQVTGKKAVKTLSDIVGQKLKTKTTKPVKPNIPSEGGLVTGQIQTTQTTTPTIQTEATLLSRSIALAQYSKQIQNIGRYALATAPDVIVTEAPERVQKPQSIFKGVLNIKGLDQIREVEPARINIINQIIKPIQTPISETEIDTSQKLEEVQRQDVDVIQRQEVKQVLQQKSRGLTITNPNIPPTEQPPNIITPNIKTPKTLDFKKADEYILFVKKKGEFKQIGKAIPFKSAILKGKQIVSTTASASFKVEPVGEPQPRLFARGFSLLSRAQFRPSKALPNVYVERREKRIKSRGELQEITFKGIRAQRVKNSFKNIFR